MAISREPAVAVERLGAKIDAWPALMLAVVVVVSAFVLLLFAIVLGLSVVESELGGIEVRYGFDNYRHVFGEALTLRVIVNTLWFSLVTLATALVFGVPAAWLVERTDLAAKTLLFTLMTLSLLVPGFTSAMGWLFLFHPRIGLVNTFLVTSLGLGAAPINIASLTGMGWVQGLNLAPVAFIMTAAAFRATDPSLEEAAYVSGAGFARTWLAVTARLVWPSILAASIYIFTIGFAAFDVPAVIGWSSRIYTFSTYLVSLIEVGGGLPDYPAAAALATAIIAAAGAVSYWYNRVQRRAHRYEVVSGKGYRPRINRLGWLAWPSWAYLGGYFLLSTLLPIVVLVWVSLLPFVQLPSSGAFAVMTFANFNKIDWALTSQSIANTATLMVLVPTVTLAIAIAFSWIALRSRIPGRGLFDFVAFLPHAVPSIVFGVAALLVGLFVIDRIVPVSGTIWILLIVFVVGRLSYATRMTNGGLIQINHELEECALISGADTGGVLRSVLIPLLAPALRYAWLWIALMCYRELTLAVLNTEIGNMTLPVLIWSTWATGQQGTAAALSLIMLLAMLPIVALYWRIARKTGFMERS